MATLLPSYEQAAALVAQYAAQLRPDRSRVQQISLASASGRVLATPILSDRDMPPFPRSTRDGFACRAAEAATHQWLPVAGSIRAGDPPAGPLPARAAWEIMTGAAVPAGADAVVMLEHVENSEGSIRLAAGRAIEPGENVVNAGAEARTGDEIIAAGTRLHAGHIAAAAAYGCNALEVFARPRAAILTTGDELVAIDETPAPGQIRNSNAPMLAALVERCGGEAQILAAAKDNSAAIEAALRDGLDADLLLISGGVSAGKFDLVEPVLAALGARFHFTGVRIQPGKPLVFGELPRAGLPTMPLFGLPGNPISSAATFLLFAAPVLARLAGSNETMPRFSLARLSRAVKGKSDLTRFVPAARSGDGAEAAAVGTQGSGDLSAFARADCFLVVPEGTERLDAGAVVRTLSI
jgi:molybdopterin molybdotransferase